MSGPMRDQGGSGRHLVAGGPFFVAIEGHPTCGPGWSCPDSRHDTLDPVAPDRADPEIATAWSRGDWMQTFTGRKFYPLDPRADEIDVADIAHALSLLCRYGGHVDRFYSVAEHCVLMSQAVTPEHALAALLHDATEAYVVDVPRPLKRQLPGYREIEAHVWDAICFRFGVATEQPAEVKDADNRILLTERDALMSRTVHGWGVDGLAPLAVVITGWEPGEAERRYLARLAWLLPGEARPIEARLDALAEGARQPHELWIEADGDRDRYIALLKEHGHLVPPVPCPICGSSDRHRHDPYDERVIRVDIFGHDVR